MRLEDDLPAAYAPAAAAPTAGHVCIEPAGPSASSSAGVIRSESSRRATTRSRQGPFASTSGGPSGGGGGKSKPKNSGLIGSTRAAAGKGSSSASAMAVDGDGGSGQKDDRLVGVDEFDRLVNGACNLPRSSMEQPRGGTVLSPLVRLSGPLPDPPSAPSVCPLSVPRFLSCNADIGDLFDTSNLRSLAYASTGGDGASAGRSSVSIGGGAPQAA